MPDTPRETVRKALTFSHPQRIPRDLWTLPWATTRYPEEVRTIQERFPSDFARPPSLKTPSARIKGDPYAAGEHTDEWGCVFTNIQAGVIGEVRTPLLPDLPEAGAAGAALRPPYELLPADRAAAQAEVNRFCGTTDRFVIGADFPRPWERYQFIRGTVNAMVDVMDGSEDFQALLRTIHDFYLAELEITLGTDVDAVLIMDDWGSQSQLLIPPELWRRYFKPLYRDYCNLAREAGTFVFMHSDGCITEIYEDLVDVGISAVNSQLGCMDLARLESTVKGRITFWGEIDRQHVLPAAPEAGRAEVRRIARHLYDPAGGVIAQFELGPAARPDTGMAIFEEWEAVGAGR